MADDDDRDGSTINDNNDDDNDRQRRASSSIFRLRRALSYERARSFNEEREFARIWQNVELAFAESLIWSFDNDGGDDTMATAAHRATIATTDRAARTTRSSSVLRQPEPFVPRFHDKHEGFVEGARYRNNAATKPSRKGFPESLALSPLGVFGSSSSETRWLYREAAFPYYGKRANRDRTFDHWEENVMDYLMNRVNVIRKYHELKHEISHLRGKLAKLGFFYLRTMDVCVCYYCGLCLRNWIDFEYYGREEKEEDRGTSRPRVDPFEEHRYWYANCFALEQQLLTRQRRKKASVVIPNNNEEGEDDEDTLRRRRLWEIFLGNSPSPFNSSADDASAATTTNVYPIRTIRASRRDPTTDTSLVEGTSYRISSFPTNAQIHRFDDLTRTLIRHTRSYSRFCDLTYRTLTRIDAFIQSTRDFWEKSRACLETMSYIRYPHQSNDMIFTSIRLDRVLNDYETSVEEQRRSRSSGDLVVGYYDRVGGQIEEISSWSQRMREADRREAVDGATDVVDGLSRNVRDFYEHSVTPLTSETRENATAMEQMLACVVCLENVRDAFFLPCRHLVSCVTCSIKLARCPVCRDVVWNVAPVLRA